MNIHQESKFAVDILINLLREKSLLVDNEKQIQKLLEKGRGIEMLNIHSGQKFWFDSFYILLMKYKKLHKKLNHE